MFRTCIFKIIYLLLTTERFCIWGTKLLTSVVTLKLHVSPGWCKMSNNIGMHPNMQHKTLWDGNKIKPRTKAVAAFRLETGQDYLEKHLHRFNILPSDNCMLCRLPDTVTDSHHLTQCAALKDNDSRDNISTILGCPKENGSHTTNLMPLEEKKKKILHISIKLEFKFLKLQCLCMLILDTKSTHLCQV